MTRPIPLRERMAEYVPSWLADHDPVGKSYGWRFLTALARFVDAGISAALGASLGAVGKGTPTALKYVGHARGIVRGRFDTDESYAAKFPTWIDRWREAGSQRRLAIELAEYLGDARVRVVNRAGHWVTVEADGSITETDAEWDWDSVSHPDRVAFWSDLWVVVYPAWAHRPGTLGTLGVDAYALGHLAPRAEIDAVKLGIRRFKAAHSCVRAVIWTSNTSLFDPTNPSSCPNGRWGAWGIYDGSSYVPSDRDLVNCRFWEPR